jgi:hypothetical protein
MQWLKKNPCRKSIQSQTRRGQLPGAVQTPPVPLRDDHFRKSAPMASYNPNPTISTPIKMMTIHSR